MRNGQSFAFSVLHRQTTVLTLFIKNKFGSGVLDFSCFFSVLSSLRKSIQFSSDAADCGETSFALD